MSEPESINQIFKEIVMKAVNEYLTAPVPENLPKSNTQKKIADKTGIHPSTLGRYLNPKASGNMPDLVETMEILKVIDKRYALMEFTKRSNCHAAQFIKENYGSYIEKHQIEADVEAPLAGEVLKLINEHQDRYDKKLIKFSMIFAFLMMLTNLYYDISGTRKIDQLRESINDLIQEVEKETTVKTKK